MKKESYDKVGIISVLLKQKLKELNECQKEKEAILKEIEELNRKGEYKEKEPIMKEKMDKNIKRFAKVTEDIKKLKEASSRKDGNIKK